YGSAALYDEQVQPRALPAPETFTAHSLPELRAELTDSRQKLARQVRDMLEAVPREKLERHEEERFLDLKLHTVQGRAFTGQYDEDGGRLVSASLAATPEFLGP